MDRKNVHLTKKCFEKTTLPKNVVEESFQDIRKWLTIDG